MKKNIGFAFATLALCAGPAQAASSARGSYSLQLVVQQNCNVRHVPGLTPLAAGSYRLGALKEYCNAASGYDMIVNYAPGTMQGAVLSLGSDSVVLNGSGSAVVSHALGPRIADREVTVTPGVAGFDTDALRFEIIVN